MRIRGSNEEINREVDENAEDSITAFFTPLHHPRSPALSYFSVQNSQDSLDVYHDAYSTLQRTPYSSSTVKERKRHFSVGAGPVENGNLVEVDCVEDSTETTGMLPKEPEVGRVRHASCSTVNNRFRSATFTGSSPCQIGRFSLSTNSLRKKLERDPVSKKTEKERPLMKIGSLQKIGERTKGVINYMPCIEMAEVSEHNVNSVNTVPELTKMNSHPEKSVINDTWLKNYVPSVETERILGYSNGPDASHQEIQLCPGRIEQSKDTIVQMYTFRPVPQRRGCLHNLREEFKFDNLRLHHNAPHLFVSSQWQQHNRTSCLYLGYRLFWAMYFSMWAVWAWIGSMGYSADISQKKYFLLYMTNWGIWILAVDTTIQAINVIFHLKKIAEEGDTTYPSMPRLMSLSWVLSNITGSLHIFITLAYWITVYPFRSDEHLTEIGVNTHIMPGLYIIIDTMVAATPRRLLHAYQPSIFFATYILFNLVYYLCGGLDYLGRPALYPVIDWTQPGRTVGIVIATLQFAIPFIHALIFGLYAARIRAWRSLKISRYVREEVASDEVEQGAQEQKV